MAHGTDLDVVILRVQGCLTDDLRLPIYQGKENPLAGHCYLASEVLFWMLGGRSGDWVPCTIRHEGSSHWFLRSRDRSRILDATASQFETPVPYAEGRGRGFLTATPSKRARTVLSALGVEVRADGVRA